MRNLWSGVLNARNENLARYDEYEHQGIKIYIDKGLHLKDTIKITLNPKFLFFKPTFSVKGVA